MLDFMLSWAVRCSIDNHAHPAIRTESTTVFNFSISYLSFLIEEFGDFLSVEVWGTKGEMIKGWLFLLQYPVLQGNSSLSLSSTELLSHVDCCSVFKGNVWDKQQGILPSGPREMAEELSLSLRNRNGGKYILQWCVLVREVRTN